MAATDTELTSSAASPTAPTPRTTRSSPALAALALGAFVVGSAELLVVGILDRIASAARVSDAQAGLLVTAYAVGICLGGPLLTAVTIRFPRRRVILGALGAYAAGTAVALVAANLGLLLVARLITGSVHGLFIGVASAAAAALVPLERRGQAMSMVFGGIAVATVIGVPLGTAVGDNLGWRAPFVGVIVLAVVTLGVCAVLLPPVPTEGSPNLRRQVPHVAARPVLAYLGLGFVLFLGQFTAFTYLAPFLRHVTHVSTGAVSLLLLAYGAASAIGTFAGGRLADRAAGATTIAGSTALAGIFVALALSAAHPACVAVLLVGWGFTGFGMVPSVQLRVVTLAGAGGDLAATLGASSVNAGIALGAVLGGAFTGAADGRAPTWAAAGLCAAAVPIAMVCARLSTGPPRERPA